MLSLEEYISKRKKEDKINEYDIDSRMDNMRICVNYVFEYFNQYLDIDEMEQKTFLNEERLVKFRKQLDMYDQDIQDWLVNIYDVHEKHIHRSIISLLKKDNLFFLYNTDNEFRSCSYDCYAQLIKKNQFLKDQTEMLFLFIKDYHSIQSQKDINTPSVYLTEDINEWLEKTWNKYKVNIWAFASDYIERFSEDDSLWPAKHKIKSNENWQPYIYDYKQKTNLFNLNTLYTRISKRPFIKGKKQYLEIIMMYIWLHSIWGDEEKYWEEYFNRTVNSL
ncbi:hypothetical protein [Peribacillus asahii]|uniref:hypothetical protein n=1 Tax=Peribacillus asahii TaxID=228899 RepID=UPI00207AE2AB|nr:hypothetical protein [Peribacillus asahii]USK60383.1 hypothetical protein LIT37_03255 [Peribacillus asahii]